MRKLLLAGVALFGLGAFTQANASSLHYLTTPNQQDIPCDGQVHNINNIAHVSLNGFVTSGQAFIYSRSDPSVVVTQADTYVDDVINNPVLVSAASDSSVGQSFGGAGNAGYTVVTGTAEFGAAYSCTAAKGVIASIHVQPFGWAYE